VSDASDVCDAVFRHTLMYLRVSSFLPFY